MAPEDYTNKTDEQLAQDQGNYSGRHQIDILIEKEWQRRQLNEQHELNEKIIATQHELNLKIVKVQSSKTFWTSLLMALIGIGGVITGVILTNMTDKPQELHTHKTIMQDQAKIPPRSQAENQLVNLQDSPNDHNKKAKDVSSQTPNIKNFANQAFKRDGVAAP